MMPALKLNQSRHASMLQLFPRRRARAQFPEDSRLDPQRDQLE